MTTIESLIGIARRYGASDIHLEAGMPVALRVRGQLKVMEQPVSAQEMHSMAKHLVGDAQWHDFMERRSFDCSTTVSGIRCRVNALHTARGIGMVIRLFSSFRATLKSLNLHPDLRSLIQHRHGLILVCGPTGSGKSSTIAALIEEINLKEARHIVSIENPIEYAFKPRYSFIRQREVGRDTPSFEQGLLDTLREDPNVVMVGEMREPETMRLTLNIAETGHLVLTTMHSSSAAEALQRFVSGFPPQVQSAVCAQLADCLVAVICQRLTYREDLGMRIPECEILTANTGVRGIIRQNNFFKLASALETGRSDGMWTFTRYRDWLDRKGDWSFPVENDSESIDLTPRPVQSVVTERPAPPPSRAKRSPQEHPTKRKPPRAPSAQREDGVFVLEPAEEDLDDIISALKKI